MAKILNTPTPTKPRAAPSGSDSANADAPMASGKAVKASSGDQLAELEKRRAGLAAKIDEKNVELRDLVARQRKLDAQIREVRDKQLSEFLKASGFADFSADAWRAAEADIKVALARGASNQ